MKLTLKNFRCHLDQTFEIPDKGIILLSGASGNGKTTILNGIYYALYGKLKKPYSHGQTTCKVILEYQSLKITRTSSPNRLVVYHNEDKYENDAAQGVINQKLGMDFDEFRASSYIIQNSQNSVLSMTPSEQQKFIEVLAFSDNTHLTYKSKIKTLIKSTQESKNKLEGKIETIDKQVNNKKNLIEKPSDIDAEQVKDLEIKQAEFSHQISSLSKQTKETQKELDEFREIRTFRQELTEKRKNLERDLETLENDLEELGDIPDQEKITDLDEKIKELNKELKSTRNYNNYLDSKNRFDKLYQEHFESLKKTKDTLKKELPSQKDIDSLKKEKSEIQLKQEEYQKLSLEAKEIQNNRDKATKIIKKTLSNVKKYYKVKPKTSVKNLISTLQELLSKYQIELESSEKLLAEYKKEHIYKCPKCNSSLVLHDKVLVEKEGPPIDDYESVLITQEGIVFSNQEHCSRLEEFIKTLETNKNDYLSKVPKVPEFSIKIASELIERVSEIEKKEEKILSLEKDIKNKNLPNSLKLLESEVKEKKLKFPKNFKGKLTVGKLEEQIRQQHQVLSLTQNTFNQAKKIRKKISAIEPQIEEINSKLGKHRKLPLDMEDKIKNLESKLSQLNQDISSTTDQLSELQTQLKLVDEYKKYQRELKEIQELETILKTSNIEMKNIERKLTGYYGLEKTCEEAQVLAMKQTVFNLNTHAESYLESLFDIPIKIQLDTKDKNKFYTKIEYKGNKYSNIDELSGGERQRCDLAYMLAANDMLSSPIILLDECLNNLDSEINQNAIEYLKDLKGSSKLVIVVSHEAVKGSFDSMINI